MKVLVVSNGFPPSGAWGTEFYTHQLATGLARRGHTVEVLHPVRDGARARYSIAAHAVDGLVVHELANPGDPWKRFADSYQNRGVEAACARLLDQLAPDVVHFTHLLWGLSVDLPRVAREHGAATVATLTDYGLLCHRGQLFDHRERRCSVPSEAGDCARCVREPAPHDAGAGEVLVRRACVRTLGLLGEFGPLVSAGDIERRRSVIAAALGQLDRWIAPTRTLHATFVRHGLDAERSACLVYGLDESAFRRPARTQPGGAGAADGPLRIGFVGQFLPHKGLAVLFEAVRRLAARLPESIEPWSVEVCGEARQGRGGAYLEALCAPGLPPRTAITGRFEPREAPRVFERLSALVVPSLWGENAPLAVLQARAAGVPVFASDVPGVREVLEPGRHGALFEPGDVEALAELLRALVRGEIARAYEPDPPLGWHAHLAALEHEYDLALGRRAARLSA